MSDRRLARPDCGEIEVSEGREWLVTNGRGGYAMGTVAGTLTRRYHGLLIAALEPPVGRRMIVPAIQCSVAYAGKTYELATNRWSSGVRVPQGWRFIESFVLQDGVPAWTYALGDARLAVALAMPAGRDEVALTFEVLRAAAPLAITLAVLAADRDHHGGPLPGSDGFRTAVDGDRATIALPACGRTLHLHAPGAQLLPAADRWSGFLLEREAERGLDPCEDYLHVLDGWIELAPGTHAGIVAGLEPAREDAASIVADARERGATIAAGAPAAVPEDLAIAADAFVIAAAPGGSSRTTVIAGYPWFSDWGRDTMIALPGLTIALGRTDVAEAILRAFARFIDGGMLPNVFPDGGAAPEYNTVDAALWFIEAARACAAATVDADFAHDLYPAIRSIVENYTRGTRYGIGADPADGLLRAGVPGVQLTWMDAKVGDRVITPRIGKPVEVNALWYAALKTAAAFADHCDDDATPYRRAAEAVRGSFERFWNPLGGCCFDVVDGPDGDDPAIRPNQLFVVSLAPELLSAERARAVVDVCARDLFTPVGLRTLAASDPAYIGTYGGDQTARDAAYHQGTVWPWLLGPFVRAHVHVYGDAVLARSFLAPLLDSLDGYAIGTLGEIFEGNPPHAPRGTIAQAWSVAEAIAALRLLEG